MPTSVPYAIPVVVHAVRQVAPRSILDVGVGFGKYGMLFREYLDIWSIEEESDLDRQAWKTRIDGIEVFEPYLTPVHEYVYDKIHIGNALDVIDSLGQYDLIFMGDVLEHFEKKDGQRLIERFYEHADRCVLLTYPTNANPRGGLHGNKYEAHLSVWTRSDFAAYERVGYTVLENQADVCAIAKAPYDPPFLVGCFAARRRGGWKQTLSNALVRTLGPVAASSLVSRLCGRSIALRAE